MIYWRRTHDFEIVNLLDSGMNPKQVALELSISIWTVYRACRRFVDGKSEIQTQERVPKVRAGTSPKNFKSNARAYANCYLRRGKIKKEPCFKCGDVKSQMHHADYNKPLDVIWACRKCHMEIHKIRQKTQIKKDHIPMERW